MHLFNPTTRNTTMRLSRIAGTLAAMAVALPALATTPQAVALTATPAPIKHASDASNKTGLVGQGTQVMAAPPASAIVVVLANVNNAAGTYGVTVKLSGQVKSSAPGSMAAYKLAFLVDGKQVASTNAAADGTGSADLLVTEAFSVGAHVLKMVAQTGESKTYSGEANLDIVKTQTSINFALGYPGNNKVVEQETAITFKGQLKRTTDTGDTGPASRKIALKIDDKTFANTTTDANGHYSFAYTIPKSMTPVAHTATVAFEGDAQYLATAASNTENFTVKFKPRLPPNVINGPALHGSGLY